MAEKTSESRESEYVSESSLSGEDVDVLEPYMFEPTGATSSDSHNEDKSDIEPECDRDKCLRTNPDDWCLCGNCQQKQQQQECVCCLELQDSSAVVKNNNLSKELFCCFCIYKYNIYIIIRKLDS